MSGVLLVVHMAKGFNLPKGLTQPHDANTTKLVDTTTTIANSSPRDQDRKKAKSQVHDHILMRSSTM